MQPSRKVAAKRYKCKGSLRKPAMPDDSFELVPVTPVRKLEREINQLKAQLRPGGEQTALISQIIEILRMNQAMVDQLSTKQGELIVKLTETNNKLERLVEATNTLVESLVESAEEGGDEEETKQAPPVADAKLDKVIEQNAVLINSLNMLAREMGKIGGKEKE